MKAVIQGEYHISQADKNELLSHIDEEVDAVLIEGRKDSFKPTKWTIGYVLFLTSAFLFYWLQSVFDRFQEQSFPDNIPVHDEIDTPLPELYDESPGHLRYLIVFLSLSLIVIGLFSPAFPVPYITAPGGAEILYSGFSRLLFLLAAVLTPLYFVLKIEERDLDKRNKQMATSIHQISTDHNYERIVISCGERHVQPIAELLEADGWEVVTHKSVAW